MKKLFLFSIILICNYSFSQNEIDLNNLYQNWYLEQFLFDGKDAKNDSKIKGNEELSFNRNKIAIESTNMLGLLEDEENFTIKKPNKIRVKTYEEGNITLKILKLTSNELEISFKELIWKFTNEKNIFFEKTKKELQSQLKKTWNSSSISVKSEEFSVNNKKDDYVKVNIASFKGLSKEKFSSLCDSTTQALYVNIYNLEDFKGAKIIYKNTLAGKEKSKFVYEAFYRPKRTYYENKYSTFNMGPLKDIAYYDYEFKEKNGQYTAFYKSGKVKCKGHHLNDKRIGWWGFYRENGKLKEKTFYKHLPESNSVIADIEIYHENGNLYYKSREKNEIRDGITEWYYENGQLETKAEYKYEKGNKEALRWNLLEIYTINGEKLDPGTIKNGNGTWKIYSEKGVLEEVNRFLKGVKRTSLNVKTDILKKYDENGKLSGTYRYRR